jgi:hypothetical protein
MEIFLIKFGYHNDHHVENLASIFIIFTPIRAKLKFWIPYGYRMPGKKNVGFKVLGLKVKKKKTFDFDHWPTCQ